MKKKAPRPPDPDDFAHEVAKGVVFMSASLEPVYEATKGYRDKCANDGWGPEAAEAMAVQYHAILLANFMPGNFKEEKDEQ